MWMTALNCRATTNCRPIQIVPIHLQTINFQMFQSIHRCILFRKVKVASQMLHESIFMFIGCSSFEMRHENESSDVSVPADVQLQWNWKVTVAIQSSMKTEKKCIGICYTNIHTLNAKITVLF